MSRLLFLILFLAPIVSFSQDICTGNLGENIFTSGDFGSGVENIVLMNPGIAPGYNYTTSPPPSDGFYILTNNMSAAPWVNLYPTWLRITDNSDDPNGYMMVVNASFEPGIFYEEEVTGLCENTLYEFSADVINLIANGVAGHIPPNISFLLDDQVQYSSGVIPQDEMWHKQGFTFTTDENQTSLKLSIRNNAPGGIGNDLALDNISFRPCGPSAFANASEEFLLCANDLDPVEIVADTEEGAAIQWQFFSEISGEWEDIENGTERAIFHDNFEPGVYNYRYLTAGTIANLGNEKCRVISDEATVTVLPIEYTVFDTLCEGSQYSFGSQTLSEAGFYEETFIASSGCDSFVDLFLSTIPDPGITFQLDASDPVCFGEINGSILISNITNAEAPYFILINDSVSGFSNTTLSAGNYTVQIIDRYLCSESVEVELIDPEQFTIDLGNDTLVGFGDQYDFNITSNNNIISGLWTGNQLECTNCVQNTVVPFENGEYVLLATDGAGCAASDSIRVNVKPLEDLFYRPNIFSPNEDGFNDKFQIYTGSRAVSALLSFRVFDRFGNLVYITRNRDFINDDYGWDGTIEGNPAVSGVYTYLYELRLINDAEIVISGDVALVR